jgi:hypothetical protein
MTTEDLLAGLSANTGLPPLVKRVSEQRLPWVVVSAAAIQDWERRNPRAWADVSEWLAAQGVALVRI